MKESYIEQTFCRKLQRRGYLTPKISDNPGWPDRLIISHGGKSCFIEFKRPGGKCSKIQEATFNTLTEMGHLVFVIDRCDDVAVDAFMWSLG